MSEEEDITDILKDFQIVTIEDVRNTRKALKNRDSYIVLDTNAPFRYLFPLCTQYKLLTEHIQAHPSSGIASIHRQLKENISEITTGYGGYAKPTTAFSHWGLSSIFTDFSLDYQQNPQMTKLNLYFQHLSEVMMIISLCESISQSVLHFESESQSTINFRYVGHQLSILYHSLRFISKETSFEGISSRRAFAQAKNQSSSQIKAKASTFLSEIEAHFDGLKGLWEGDGIEKSESDWLFDFSNRVLKTLFTCYLSLSGTSSFQKRLNYSRSITTSKPPSYSDPEQTSLFFSSSSSSSSSSSTSSSSSSQIPRSQSGGELDGEASPSNIRLHLTVILSLYQHL
ncbi:uncharacterized protein MONOS_17806 [Monocercomonoides exilis]|uniref:uncharacterized protein n=1 Tax=Monocercomonoides exilis TaxID=2049356 RepID=UPI003559EEF4|nr:hypothetical protein MONOS_17806 [Monocercomonoides exilis]